MIGNVRTFAAILTVLMSISVLGSEIDFLSTVQELHGKVCEAITTLGVDGATLPDEITTVAQAKEFMNRSNIYGRKSALRFEQSEEGQAPLASISLLLAEIERLQKNALDRMPQ